MQWVPGLSRESSGRGVALITHPNLAPSLKIEQNCTPFPPSSWVFMAFSRVKFTFVYFLLLGSEVKAIGITGVAAERKVEIRGDRAI
jgi:hypothetical protein